MRSVSVEIAKRTYELRYSHNVVCKIEETAQQGIGELFTKGMAISAVRYLLWGGLLSQFPKVTLDQAGNLISKHIEEGGQMEDIVPPMVQALEECGVLKREAVKEGAGAEDLMDGPLAAKPLSPDLLEPSPLGSNDDAAGIPG
jgi:hypothetical protein